MNPKQAKRRYWKVFVPSMGLYLATTFAAAYLSKQTDLPIIVKGFAALIPALCIIWLIWGHGRWIFETDEYERYRQIRGILIGVAVTLAFASVWGFMEMLLDAPKFPVFYTFVIFCVAYSLGTCFSSAFMRKGVVMDDGDIV